MRESKYDKLVNAIGKDIQFNFQYNTQFDHVLKSIKNLAFSDYDDNHCVIYSEDNTHKNEVEFTPVIGYLKFELDEQLVKQYRKCDDNQKTYLDLLYDIREENGIVFSNYYCGGHWALVRR